MPSNRNSWKLPQSRRTVLGGLAAFGLAGALRPSAALADEGHLPETSTVRFANFPGGLCTAPQYVAEHLLRDRGFSDFRNVTVGLADTTASLVESDAIDFSLDFASAFTIAVDNGVAMTALGGLHVGCYMLFAREGINNILDLKGRSVGVGPQLGSDPHVFVSAMATYVGLDPKSDINWVVSEVTPWQLFEEGKIDALLSFPPEAQELQRRKVGHVIINSMVDHPWSQYFCCMALANTAYVQKHPIATKQVLRAVFEGAELCISDPKQVARLLVDSGYATAGQYDFALEALSAIPYTAWRDYDPEDTVRFFALRLHEAGMIKSNPQTIIAAGTDWRFLKDIRRELKA